MATKTREKFTTPKGTLAFPAAIQEPDNTYADDTDADDLGEYKARLRLKTGSGACNKLIAELQAIFDRHCEETKALIGKKKLKMSEENLPWGPELDRETEEETGYTIFRTKLKARIKKKKGGFFDQSPKVFDENGTPVAEVPNIGPGSVVRLAGQIHCWHNTAKGAGMSLWLEAVQLFELVEGFGQPKTAEGYGFAVTKEETPFDADDGDDDDEEADADDEAEVETDDADY